MEIKKCTVSELWSAENFSEILIEYAEESAISGLPRPNPVQQLYQYLEDTGKFDIFGCYKDDNMLIGFISLLTSILPHYGELVSVTESFFVLKEHRFTGAGLSLLSRAEDHINNIGARGFLVSSPLDGSLIDVLPRVGYKPSNQIFFKEFNNG